MEAVGIEPTSEELSTKGATCLSCEDKPIRLNINSLQVSDDTRIPR
jgi:hypothetical protein